MATTTAFETRQNTPTVVSGIATIDANETATLSIPCHGRAHVNLGLPTMTGTTLTFTVQAFPPADPASPTIDPPFRPLYDGAGNVVQVTATDDSLFEVPELAGCYAFTIVSGSSEASAREIEVQCIGINPVSAGVNNVEIEPGASVTANQGTQAASATGSTWFVQGAAANAATLAGNPNLLGGSDGTSVYSLRTINDASDNQSAVTNGVLRVGAETYIYDPTNAVFVRRRSNFKSTLAASAARTTTLTVSDQTNQNGSSVHVIINVTVMASGGLTPVINGKDNLGVSYAILTGTKIVSTGTTVLKVGPGFATVAGGAAADMIPQTWNVVVTPDDATSITYSVGGNRNE